MSDKETITITTRCPIGSYIRWGLNIQSLLSGRGYDVVESSSVDETIPTDEINRTTFSFEVHWSFALDFMNVLCQANPYLRPTTVFEGAATPEPQPTPGGVDIPPLVIEDIKARAEMGKTKYGTVLQAHNGRDALIDAYQESLDQTVYLRQLIEELSAMRDYQHIERYLNALAGDIYPQPPDPGHQAMLENICGKWLPTLTNLNSILDIGCGQGQAFPVLERYAQRVEGVTLGSDFDVCRDKGIEVRLADMSFLPYPDGEFDMIFARHVLEHSPAPLLSLMEWWRVSKQWLMLILPDPKHYKYGGKNHYYVLNRGQLDNVLAQAGWRAIWRDEEEKTEIRLFCEKVKR